MRGPRPLRFCDARGSVVLRGTPAPPMGRLRNAGGRRTWLTALACLSALASVCLSVQLERARSEAGEALNALRRLQRCVSELEEESRLQDSDMSGTSLQSELAHSLDSDQHQNTDGHRDALVSSRPTSPNMYHPGGLQTPPLFLFP